MPCAIFVYASSLVRYLINSHDARCLAGSEANVNREAPELVGTVALTGAKLKPNEKGFDSSLDRVRPGILVRVDVEAGEINFGFDHRIIGKIVSYEDGKVNLEAVDVPAGYVQKNGFPTAHVGPDADQRNAWAIK